MMNCLPKFQKGKISKSTSIKTCPKAKGAFEKDYIRKSLEMNDWNVSKTAEYAFPDPEKHLRKNQ